MASAADLPRLNESAGRCRYTHSSSFSSSQNVLPSMSGIRVNSSITSRTVGLSRCPLLQLHTLDFRDPGNNRRNRSECPAHRNKRTHYANIDINGN